METRLKSGTPKWKGYAFWHQQTEERAFGRNYGYNRTLNNYYTGTKDLDDDSLLKKARAALSLDGLDLTKLVKCSEYPLATSIQINLKKLNSLKTLFKLSKSSF